MIKTNKEKLLMLSVMGKISHPTSYYRYNHDREGNSIILPGSGGITYNFSIGDLASRYYCDHVEPGVSIRNDDPKENGALMVWSCFGNEAKVVTGDAKGALGRVTGSHAGVDRTIVHFNSKEDLYKLTLDDKIQIKGYGCGLKLLDYPDIVVTKCDPRILEVINPEEKQGKIYFPVTTIIPAYLMGAGIGADHGYAGDYDIMTQDDEANEKYNLKSIRVGDFVMLENCDNTYGRGYLTNSVSIGVVIHSDCIALGHGPGVTVMMTCKKQNILPIINPDANLVKYFSEGVEKQVIN